jgi:hypothetical protein
VAVQQGASGGTGTAGPQEARTEAGRFGGNSDTYSQHARRAGSGRSKGWSVAVARSQPCTTISVSAIRPGLLAASERGEPNGQGVHMAEQAGDGVLGARDGAGLLVIGDSGRHIGHALAGRP